MGVAAWTVWQQPLSQPRTYALAWFAIQLGLNFLWSMIFFRWHAIADALGEISILWLAILATMVMFWEVYPLAGWLMVPYLAWVSFATVLNLGIFRLNRNR
jgi:tryptophan-rich sensory protein